MVVLFDSRDVAVGDRVEAFESALNTAIFPSAVRLDSQVVEPSARIEHWGLGAGISVLRTVSSGATIARTPAQIRRAASEALSISMSLSGAFTARQGSRTYRHLGSINSIHGMMPFDVAFKTKGASPSVSMCAQIDFSRLGLPMDLIEATLPNLSRSPLYSFVQAHLAALPRAAAEVEGTPAAVMVGSSTTDLARALMTSVSADDRLAKDSFAGVLTLRIDAYIRDHYADHSLTAEKIAAEHNISVRYLYALFARRGRSLQQQIIQERLEHARDRLADRTFSARSIEAVARHCGFAHPQHFSLRFREAYCMTPRDWRRLSQSNYPAAPGHAQKRLGELNSKNGSGLARAPLTGSGATR